MPKFWPAIKANKMHQDYSDIAYTKTVDFHDFIEKEYFSIPKFVNKPKEFNYRSLLEHKVSKIINDQEHEYVWDREWNKWVHCHDDECEFPKYSIEEIDKDLNEDNYISFKGVKKQHKKFRQFDNLPVVPSIIFDTPTNKDTEIRFKINLKDGWKEIYGKDFDFRKVNWWKSDFAILSSKINQTYWHVVSAKNTYDTKTNEIVAIEYYCKLDVASTFFYLWWNYEGVVSIKRMHNNRWTTDDIFNTGNLIPDFNSNRFIANCDDYCASVNSKTQYERTQVLINTKNFEPSALGVGRFKDTPDTIWDKDKEMITTNKRWCVLVWAQSAKSGRADTGNNPQEWTVVNEYNVPFNLYIYLPTDLKSMNTEIAKLYSEVQKDHKVVYANISEWVFDTNQLEKVFSTDYIYAPRGSNPRITIPTEYFVFHDANNILTDKIFLDPRELTSSPTIKAQFEPHLWTSNHYEMVIGMSGKNNITFDVNTLMFSKNENERLEYFSATNSWKILKRKGLISPEEVAFKYFLLDNDTSVANKRDNNLLTMNISGPYNYPYWSDAYVEFMKTHINQKQAGIDNIHQQKQQAIGSAWLGAGSSMASGALGGAAMGMLGGPIGIAAGAAVGALGGLAGSAFNVGSAYFNAKNNEEMSLRSLNAQYNDAKNMPANISASMSGTSADLTFMEIDDEYNPFGYKKLWTPSLTINEIPSYEKDVIAWYLNKNGYPQDNARAIKGMEELMVRRLWNKVQIANMTEFFKQNEIPDEFVIELIDQMNRNGIRFWNLENIDYGDIYNYNLNNYEETIKSDITLLEGEIYD